ncbi:Crp/Fnr family transcriptional regulator [uncultured Sulfitobacter sp.]|uniref:Crp/Fnr family transcriptional regulator n=1 Tax=uncultured Sulfitobacter sp. TaxID=191468 RepID=UPI00261A6F9C|nr:Crp/Fnr family transcriptional regulator [uncultured Sulfitobacter sp.]
MSSLNFFNDLLARCGAATAKQVALQAGEALFHQGDAPIGLILVESGELELVRWTQRGGGVRIHTAKQGQTFAEASLFAETCHCDAVARVASGVCILPKVEVLAAFASEPDLSNRFSAYLAQSLMATRRMLELRAMRPLGEGMLARLAEVVKADGALPKEVTLLSLADDLGVTGPALYRALTQLEKDGRVIRPARGRVQLVR